MNRQEVFNTIWEGLKAQDFQPSVVDHEYPDGHFELGCRYRGPNNLKCPIGHLMADDEYDPVFEGRRIYNIWLIANNTSSTPTSTETKARQFVQRLDLWAEADVDFLMNIQVIHDRLSDTAMGLVDFANARGLTIPGYDDLEPEIRDITGHWKEPR